MKLLKEKSIARNFKYAQSTVIILAIVIVMIIFAISSIMEMKKEMKTNLEKYSKKIYDIVAIPMWDLNNQAVEKIGESFLSIENIGYIKIGYLKKNNTEITEEIIYENKKKEAESGVNLIDKEIFYNGMLIGKVTLGMIDKNQNTITNKIIQIGGACNKFCVFPPASKLGKYIILLNSIRKMNHKLS